MKTLQKKLLLLPLALVLLSVFVSANASVMTSLFYDSTNLKSLTIVQGQSEGITVYSASVLENSMTIEVTFSKDNIVLLHTTISKDNTEYCDSQGNFCEYWDNLTISPAIYSSPGTYTINSTVTAASGQKATDELSLTVLSANNPPIIISNPTTSVNENASYSYDVNATDADGDTLTYSISGPSWLSINSSTGLISGTAPNVTADTPYDITITVSDGTDSATQSYTLTVLNVTSLPPANNPPVIISTPLTSVNESTAYSYDVNATDADNDTLTYSISGPSWLSIDSSTGLVSGTSPSVTADTPYDITITVSDGTDSATQSYTLTVLNVTSPPPANNVPVITSTPVTSVNENEAYFYDVNATDADGDTLTYSISGPSWLSINSSTGLISGTAPLVSADTNVNVIVSVTDGTDTVTQSYTLTIANVSGTTTQKKTGTSGLKTITDDFAEQKYLNQFAPINAAEEETPATKAKSNVLKIFLIILWLVIFLLLVILAVLLARRMRK